MMKFANPFKRNKEKETNNSFQNNYINQINNQTSLYDEFYKDSLLLSEKMKEIENSNINKQIQKNEEFLKRTDFYNKILNSIVSTKRPENEIQKQIAYQELYILERNKHIIEDNPISYPVNAVIKNNQLQEITVYNVDEQKGFILKNTRVCDENGQWKNTKAEGIDKNKDKEKYEFIRDTLMEKDYEISGKYRDSIVSNIENEEVIRNHTKLFKPIEIDMEMEYRKTQNKNLEQTNREQKIETPIPFNGINIQDIIKQEQEQRLIKLRETSEKLMGNYSDNYTDKFKNEKEIIKDNFSRVSNFGNCHELVKENVSNKNGSFIDYINESTEFYKQLRETNAFRKDEIQNSINTIDIKSFYKNITQDGNPNVEKQYTKRSYYCKEFCAVLNTYRDLKINGNDINIENLKFVVAQPTSEELRDNREIAEKKDIIIYMQVGNELVKSTINPNQNIDTNKQYIFEPLIETVDKNSLDFKVYTQYLDRNRPNFEDIEKTNDWAVRFDKQGNAFPSINLNQNTGQVNYLVENITKAQAYYNAYKDKDISIDAINNLDDSVKTNIYREATIDNFNDLNLENKEIDNDMGIAL